jgi:hypothetical protein
MRISDIRSPLVRLLLYAGLYGVCFLGLMVSGSMAAYAVGLALVKYTGLSHGWALMFASTWACAGAVWAMRDSEKQEAESVRRRLGTSEKH